MRGTSRALGIVTCFLVVTSAGGDELLIDELDWLAGEWIGTGQEGENGKAEGEARLYWTPPLEGSVSYFFTWHAPEHAHVHYAIGIFEQAERGVAGKGIHYAPDFSNFEEPPWELRASGITNRKVEFDCVQFCRPDRVSFTLLDNGELEERWSHDGDDDRPDWIVRYRRKN